VGLGADIGGVLFENFEGARGESRETPGLLVQAG